MELLGVPVERIRSLGGSWSDGGLWDDILWLSLLAWTATGERERQMRWHHLVMAVGNFKRQSGRRLRPSRLSPVRNLAFAAVADRFRAPDDLLIIRDDAASWSRLKNSLPGSATATTTTILPALWPDTHHILDWRVLAAVAGLGVAAGDEHILRVVQPDSRDQLPPTLVVYTEVRILLVRLAAEASLPLSTLERALYLMSRAVNGKGMTWAEYGAKLSKATPRHGSPGEDGTSDDERDTPPAAP